MEVSEGNQRKRGRPKGSKKKPGISRNIENSTPETKALTRSASQFSQDNRWFPNESAKRAAYTALEAEYEKQEKNSIDKLGEHGENHITAISVARDIMLRIIAGEERIIVVAPTLSGKTSIMKSLAKMQRAVINVASILYHCGVNYVENRRQTAERLALEKVRICSLRERRLAEEITAPSLTIYDETQICQRPDQTLAAAFKKSKTFHKTGSVTVAFSATPNSVLAGHMFTQIWVPLKQWITKGYCDIQYLIDSGRLVDADPIFLPIRQGKKGNGKLHDWDINPEANALRHLVHILSAPNSRNGFSLIRLPKKLSQIASDKLMSYLQVKGLTDHARFIFYTEANPDLGPNLFRSNPSDAHCVVFIKNKLSVGIDLDTRWIKLFYEYSPNATVESFAQSAAGRASGWNKKKHECVIYTSMKHAKVYSLFLHKGWDEYLKAAKDANIQISTGAKIVSEFSREVVNLASYQYPDTINLKTLKREVKNRVGMELGLQVDTTRSLSATKFKYGKKRNPIWTPDQPAKDFRPSNHPGTVTVNILNCYHPSLKRQKNWDGAIIRVIQTTENIIEDYKAEPHKSIHSPDFFV